MNGSNARWKKAFNWVKRCSNAHPEVVAHASIGSYHLSCQWSGKRYPKGQPVFHMRSWHTFEEGA